MPIIRKCPKCGFEGNHGFGLVNGGMYFYHGHKKNDCFYYEGISGKIYDTHYDLFINEVIPNTPKTPASLVWIEARKADLTGHPRKAKKLYEQWKHMSD